MSNTINYVVSYDSDYLNPDGSVNLSATILTNVTDIQYQRNIAPSEDNATLTLAGIQRIQSAREIYIYRVNSDGTYTLKFRGMTTNPKYSVSDQALVTTIEVQSLWYMLSTRLFQIAGKSPPPLQPNTNPYLVYLNPTLGLNFGQLWADIITFAFQESYSTGHLPAFHLANLQDDGEVNQTIPYLTDFDFVVVNDNMNLQYQSISATVDRLVTSALFNSNESSPFLTEYRMNIGDFPYTIPPRSAGSLADTFTPKLPTVTVMLFDPVHSKLGNGQNRTGINLGDNSLDPEWVTGECGVTPSGLTPQDLLFPMSYIEFGVYNGYCPVDTIIFSEGDNIVSIDLTYDYTVMNNSYVLTGGSFQGSDVVALPIDNQRSIAEFGLKQTNQPLQNVVDQGEIQRFVGTSINFFQHPIPHIVLNPDYVYFSQHTMYAGDYILVNAPSLAGVMEDSNGQLLEGSYGPAFDPVTHQSIIVTAAFTARIKTIDVTWNPTDGEDITLTLTFPVQNVPIDSFFWNPSGNTQLKGSPAGAMQFMYTTVQPAARTMLGRGRQSEGAAIHQTGEDFIASRNSPFTERVTDTGTAPNPVPSAAFLNVPMYAQAIANNMNAIVNDSPTSPTTIETAKGDDILIYQFGVEVDTPNTAPSNTVSAPSDVYLTVLQPDGMAILDTIVSLNQMTNILSLISKSHKFPVSGTTTSATPTILTDGTLSLITDSLNGLSLSYTSGPAKGQSQEIISNTATTITTATFDPAPTPGGGDTYKVNSASTPFLTDLDGNSNLSGRYEIIVRNANASSWCPDPLFQSVSKPPTAVPAVAGTNISLAYIVVPCVDIPANPTLPATDPFGMTHWVSIYSNQAPNFDNVTVSWDAIPGANSYNVYRIDLSSLPPPALPDDMLSYAFLGNSTTTSFIDTIGLGLGDGDHEPYPPFATLLPTPALGGHLVNTTSYWYAITATDIAGNETVCSAGSSYDRLGNEAFEPILGNTIVNGDSGPGFPPINRLYVTSTAPFLANYPIVIDSGGPRQEYNVVTDVQPTYLTLQNNLFYTHTAAQADVVATMVASIYVEWPKVQNAVSYNIYRGDGLFAFGRASLYLLQTDITDTNFTDDGTYTPSGSIHPSLYADLKPGDNAYTVYVNYAFLQDPKHTQIVTTGGSNNPSTAIVYDPTQRRVYGTHGYVAP